MRLSTTIDFNDNTQIYTGPEGYYPVEKFEESIRQLIEEAGIRKFNLRVNCCGLSNHPSKVVPVYGDYGGFGWTRPVEALRLIQTMVHYDCCKEFVRICHKYGAEAWAWESLCDDAGIASDISKVPEYLLPAYHRKHGWSGMDDFYLEHPEAMAARDPLRIPTKERTEKAQEQVRRVGIGKIVITNHSEWTGILRPPKETPENLKLYVSDDNQSFRIYDGPVHYIIGQTEDGRNQIILEDLDIHSPYLKLHCTISQEPAPYPEYTMVLRMPEGQVEVYDREGAPVTTGWAVNKGYLDSTPVDFLCWRGNAAWDSGDRFFGDNYLAGAVGPAPLTPYLYGFAEYNVPIAMEHKVARFEELTHYDFDGFIFNTRSHSGVNFAEQYGYNPEVLAKFKDRFGRDYSGTPEDVRQIFQIRGEALAEFFRRCKATTGGRPLFISGPMPLEYEGDPNYNITFGPMPWLYKRFFAEGSIDGVIMIGKNFENGVDFSSYFTPEITGGKKITLGIFREMFGRPDGYDLAADMEALRKSNLDEVELYESIMLNRNPQAFPFLRGDAAPDAKMTWKWSLGNPYDED